MPVTIEAVETLHLGPGLTDIAVAVFVSHEREARATELNDAEMEALDVARGSYMLDYEEDIIKSTKEQVIRFLHTDLGDGNWMTTSVFGPSRQVCIDVLRRMYPDGTFYDD